jgi:hypothetical protein
MLEQDKIPPSREALREAFELSGQLLNDLETSTTSLTSIALKTGRLGMSAAVLELSSGLIVI